ncbi:MAG: segregation/condensation protein A [Deltaproteobacteria bacterium]|nr:segregation/condensation protein A [Deltaproteobacteria bacterium]
MMSENNFYSEGKSPYTVRLEMFEGPLDLLLHLIQKNEMDIFNIPIALITEQYLDYLKWMKTLNLDIAGDYLLVASTLLHIKSRMLLPQPSVEEEEEGEDPRAELVRRLLEYQKYKMAATELVQRPMLDRDVFIRLTSTEERATEEEKIEANLFDLIDALRKALSRATVESFHEVTLDRLSVEDKVQEILLLLQKEKRSLPFHLLFPEQASRRVIVITFLAILELVKAKWIRVFQAAPFETIRISPV